MRPEASVAVRWGWIAAAAALALLLVAALVPDPLFRQHVFRTEFDNVESISAGVPVYFRGAEIGAVRSVALDPALRTFAVRLGVARAFRPSPCSFAQIVETNPFTTPHVELVALEEPAAACPAGRAAAGCVPVPARSPPDLTGCARAPDLFAVAAAAVGQVASVAKVASAMAEKAQAMMAASGGQGPGVVQSATATLATLNSLTDRLNRTLTPGQGDVALTLANVRRASGAAASVDVASLNGTLVEVRKLVAQNQAAVTSMLAGLDGATGQSRAMLENMSGSLTAISANLAASTDRLDALSERIAADPTFALHGRRFADPPPPTP